MTTTPDLLRARLQDALNKSPLDATDLARQIGRGADYIRDFLNGRKDSIKPAELVMIEQVLSIKFGYLSGLEYVGVDEEYEYIKKALETRKNPKKNYRSGPMDIEAAKKLKVRVGFDLDPDFKIHAAREGPSGTMVVYKDPIDTVVRPWFLKDVSQGYVVQIADDLMSPVFDAGDFAIVNPRTPLLKHRNCILISDRGEGEFRAMVRQLTGWDETHWNVRQLNPPKARKLSRAEWPEAYRVIAKLDG